jgi:hypothetical protein
MNLVLAVKLYLVQIAKDTLIERILGDPGMLYSME